MIEAIEKLKNVKKKLISEKEEIDVELNRIDGAIDKFSEGIEILSGDEKPRGSATAEIETILREAGKPLHVRQITDVLHERGFSIAQQSVSAALQIKAKRRDKFYKAAPATFDLLENKSKPFAQAAESGEENEEEVTFV